MVDLFAGPGGLGEGFAAVLRDNGRPCFRNVASFERDKFAFRTLQLRHFLREFPHGEFPEEYYSYLSGNTSFEELVTQYPKEYQGAKASTHMISLGPESHAKVRATVREKLKNHDKWALVGGPPCQAYSLVGRSRMKGDPGFASDERHFLYREYLKIIVDHRPPVFVMENVKGLLSAQVDGEPVVDRIVSDLKNPKSAVEGKNNGLSYELYSLTEGKVPKDGVDPRLFLVKSEDFGVPQARHRMFIVGIRSDLEIEPARLRKRVAPNVKDTIGHLPRIRSGLSRSKRESDEWQSEIGRLVEVRNLRRIQKFDLSEEFLERLVQYVECTKSNFERSSRSYPGRPSKKHQVLIDMYDERLSVLDAHEARSHMGSDLRRYLYAATFAELNQRSPKLVDFPEFLLPAHQNVEQGRAGKMFSDRFRVQLADRFSSTVTSHISKDGHYFIHYDPAQCRSLTVREAARLQSFPDNYKFEGPRTSQYHQVGNAVPPFLAKQIGEIVSGVLDSIDGPA